MLLADIGESWLVDGTKEHTREGEVHWSRECWVEFIKRVPQEGRRAGNDGDVKNTCYSLLCSLQVYRKWISSLCTRKRGEGRCCSPHSCARPLSLSLSCASPAQLWGGAAPPLSPLPCAQRGVIFNGSAWWETTKNYLYYQHPILAGVGET